MSSRPYHQSIISALAQAVQLVQGFTEPDDTSEPLNRTEATKDMFACAIVAGALSEMGLDVAVVRQDFSIVSNLAKRKKVAWALRYEDLILGADGQEGWEKPRLNGMGSSHMSYFLQEDKTQDQEIASLVASDFEMKEMAPQIEAATLACRVQFQHDTLSAATQSHECSAPAPRLRL